MTVRVEDGLTSLWTEHQVRWRNPAEALAVWDGGSEDPRLLVARPTGGWWEVLDRLKITLLVTREYEHLMLAASVHEDRPHLSYLPLPHPSGLAVDRGRRIIAVASTRNPNQVFELSPVSDTLPRGDVRPPALTDQPLLPIRSTLYPGALYIHDLAYIGSTLHANSVGQNAIAALSPDGHRLVWWPRCVERDGEPVISINYIQLNSIAAGETLQGSFFTASTDRMSTRRPGHLNFPVDRRGVLFSGATREPVLRGLTRPHSARLHQGSVWIDDSGYGRLVVSRGGSPETVTTLPGWTRGLCVHESGIAFVGTSRVIPRFSHYAPGLVPDKSRCAVHAVELASGRVLGSLTWPSGNQIFAIDWIPRTWSSGLPFQRGARTRTRGIFYTFGANRRNTSK